MSRATFERLSGKKAPKRGVKIPQAKSAGEEEFRILYYQRAPDAVWPVPAIIPQHVFHPTRKWALDWSVPSRKLAVEIQGMHSGHGELSRHRRVAGMENDYQKLNAAQEFGWTVLVGTRRMVPELVDQLLRILAKKA